MTFERKDLFTADLADASVVAVYLLPKQLEKLVPQLEKLKPGSRIVSHHFTIPGKEPDEVISIESKEDGEKHTVYLWRTPLKSAPAASTRTEIARRSEYNWISTKHALPVQHYYISPDPLKKEYVWSRPVSYLYFLKRAI